MGGGAGEGSWGTVPQPTVAVVAPPDPEREDYHWSSFDDSVNAVSFGFVATAILISMFLLMAIFEKFLRARTSSSAASPSHDRRTRPDVESQVVLFHGKLDHSPPKALIYAKEVSVLMPGDEIPTFIANPTPPPPPPPPPPPCPPERSPWPPHQPNNLQLSYLSSSPTLTRPQ